MDTDKEVNEKEQGKVDLRALAVPRTEAYLARLSHDKAVAFIVEQHRAYQMAKAFGAIFAANLGYALRGLRHRLGRGRFRVVAEGECGLAPSSVTHYLKCAENADEARARGVSIEDMSAQMMLKLVKQAREGQPRQPSKWAKPVQEDQHARSNRKAGEIRRVMLQLDFYAEDDPVLLAELVLPELRRLVKRLSDLNRRAKDVTASESDDEGAEPEPEPEAKAEAEPEQVTVVVKTTKARARRVRADVTVTKGQAHEVLADVARGLNAAFSRAGAPGLKIGSIGVTKPKK